MHYIYGRKPMLCGSYEAETRTYKKLIGKDSIWFVANQKNPADNVYCYHPGEKNSQGFGGRTLGFKLEDGTIEHAQGPWHSNADALYHDTGYDIQDKYLTFVAIGLKRYQPKKGEYTLMGVDDLIYIDKEWAIGKYSRDKELAKELANKFGVELQCLMESQGGGSCGYVLPDPGIYITPWEHGFYQINISHVLKVSGWGGGKDEFLERAPFNTLEEAQRAAQGFKEKEFPDLEIKIINEKPVLLQESKK